jgi:hypothetical protein
MKQVAFAGVLVLAAFAAAGAQQQAKPSIPAEMMPPKGMCRIWIQGIQPSQQPAPTTCDVAIKNKPANAQVVFSRDESKTVPPRQLVSPPRSTPPVVSPQNAKPPVAIPPKPPGRGGGG